MSVVNKMLQDLETRQASASGASADYQPPVKRSKHLWLVLLLLLFSIGCLVYWWFGSGMSVLSKPSPELNSDLSVPQAQKKLAKTMLVSAPEAVPKPDTESVEQAGETHHALVVPAPTQAALSPSQSGLMQDQGTAPVTALHNISATGAPLNTPANPETPVPRPANPGSFQIKDSSLAQQKSGLKQGIKDALAANNSSLAITLLNQLMEQEPDNVEALKKLAALLFAVGQAREASQLLQQSILQAPLRADVRLMLARLYVQQNQPDSALGVLQAIEPAQYLEIDYLSYRAHLAQQLANYTLAKQDYLTLTQVDNNNARWWLGLAISEEHLGAGSRALDYYYQAQNLAQLDGAVTDFIAQRIRLLAGAP